MKYKTNAKIGAAALVAAIMSATVAGVGETAAAPVPPAVETAAATDVVATVEGRDITAAEYVAYYRAFARQRFYHRTPPQAEIDALKTEVMERLVLFHLLRMEAERRDLEVDEQEIEKEIAAVRGRLEHGDTRQEFESRVDELRRNLRSNAQVSKLVKSIREVPPATAGELRKFYEDNPTLFTEPSRQRVRAIVIGVQPWDPASAWESAKTVADDVMSKLQAGGDFAALAEQHSTHDSATAGGDLGYLHAGMLSAEAEEVVSGLEPGQYAGPVRTLEGYIVLQLIDRTPAELQSFEAVRERAEALLARDRSEDQWFAFTSRLRRDAVVEVTQALPLEIDKAPQ